MGLKEVYIYLFLLLFNVVGLIKFLLNKYQNALVNKSHKKKSAFLYQHPTSKVIQKVNNDSHDNRDQRESSKK